MDRKGTLPEDADYTDTGCEESPKCVLCPLAVCKYELITMSKRDTAIDALRHRIADLTSQGLHAQGVADQLGIAKRSVFRHLRALKDEYEDERETPHP